MTEPDITDWLIDASLSDECPKGWFDWLQHAGLTVIPDLRARVQDLDNIAYLYRTYRDYVQENKMEKAEKCFKELLECVKTAVTEFDKQESSKVLPSTGVVAPQRETMRAANGDGKAVGGSKEGLSPSNPANIRTFHVDDLYFTVESNTAYSKGGEELIADSVKIKFLGKNVYIDIGAAPAPKQAPAVPATSLEIASAWIHDIWSKWFKYQRNGTDADFTRWEQQARTDYAGLWDSDKEKDRTIIINSPLWKEVERLRAELKQNQQALQRTLEAQNIIVEASNKEQTILSKEIERLRARLKIIEHLVANIHDSRCDQCPICHREADGVDPYNCENFNDGECDIAKLFHATFEEGAPSDSKNDVHINTEDFQE